MSKQLLLIDDDEDEKFIFCEALEEISSNYTCLYASGAAQAVQMLDIARPDIIFVDLNMPRINGLDCIKLLRNLPYPQGFAIVLYSTGLDEGVIKQAERNGVSVCIQKPHTFNEVKTILNALIQTFTRRR